MELEKEISTCPFHSDWEEQRIFLDGKYRLSSLRLEAYWYHQWRRNRSKRYAQKPDLIYWIWSFNRVNKSCYLQIEWIDRIGGHSNFNTWESNSPPKTSIPNHWQLYRRSSAIWLQERTGKCRRNQCSLCCLFFRCSQQGRIVWRTIRIVSGRYWSVTSVKTCWL